MFGVVACVGVLCVRPCLESAYWGIGRCEYDVREYVPVHHSAGSCVCCIIVGDSRVWFYLAYVGCEAFFVSNFYDVVGVH